jgi:hypothetical protein
MTTKPDARDELKARGDAMSIASGRETMMELNGSKYRMPQPLSTGVMRTYKREYAQRQAYRVGAPVLFDFNTGTSYVEPQSALLSFDLAISNLTGDNRAWSWGSGLGGCSLFEEIRIISKNGVEIDRTQQAHVLAKVRADYTLSKESRTNLEMCDGYPSGSNFVVPAGTTRIFPITIPLKVLSGFFRPTVEAMLIPAGLASGLRIEMILASASRAFQWEDGGTATAPVYEVQNPEILLQLTDLSDPVQSALMKESAQTGLEYTFPSYFATVAGNSGSSQITEQVKKAVSQATRLFTAIYDKEGTFDVDRPGVDGFASIRADRLGGFQYRVGSSYYPQQTVTRFTEMWATSNSAFDFIRKLEWSPNTVDFVGFSTGGKSLLSTSLETNDRLNLSGLPINNSSVAEFRFTQKDGTHNNGDGSDATSSVDAVIFVEFIAVVKTSINRATLRI